MIGIRYKARWLPAQVIDQRGEDLLFEDAACRGLHCGCQIRIPHRSDRPTEQVEGHPAEIDDVEVIGRTEPPRFHPVPGDQGVGDRDPTPVEIAVMSHGRTAVPNLSHQLIDGAVRLPVGTHQRRGVHPESRGGVDDHARVLTGTNDHVIGELKRFRLELLQGKP